MRKSVVTAFRNLLVIYVNDFVLVFLLLTLNIFRTFFSVSLVDFAQVNLVTSKTS